MIKKYTKTDKILKPKFNTMNKKIWDQEKRICEPKDLLPIAVGQMKAENDLAKKSNSLLITLS